MTAGATTWIMLGVAAAGAGCARAHCPPAEPEDAGPMDAGSDAPAGDAAAACAQPSRLFLSVLFDSQSTPDMQPRGCADYPGTRLRVYVYELGTTMGPRTVMNVTCGAGSDYVELPPLPPGSYELGMETVEEGWVVGAARIRPPPWCREPGFFLAGCDPEWLDVPPCGVRVVPVSLKCDESVILHCGGS